MIIADRLNNVFSDIRGPVYERALAMEAEGKKVLKLNTGNPGVFGFPMPESIRRSIEKNAALTVPYSNSRGIPAVRERIAAYHATRGMTVSPDDVFLSNGVSEGVSMLLTALLNDGDEVLVPSPCYSLWSNEVYLNGSTPVFYRCVEEDRWQPDVADIEKKITPRTRAILVINPNNPTGVLYSPEVLEKICRVAEKHKLMIFSDEIYDRLIVTDKKFVSTATLASKDTVVVTFNGLSKSHVVCGLRSAWFTLTGPESERAELNRAIMKLACMRLCSNTMAQRIIIDALDDPESTRAMLVPGGRLYDSRKATMDAVAESHALSVVPNDAAFYCFVKLTPDHGTISNDRKFCLSLLEETHILLVPGSGFMYNTPDHARIVMLPEASQLYTAMKTVGEFTAAYRE